MQEPQVGRTRLGSPTSTLQCSVPELLLQPPQLCGSQLHVSEPADQATAQGLDCGNSARLQICRQGAPNDHAHQTSPQRYAGDVEIHRFPASVAKGKQARSGVVSIASKFEMRLAAADRFPGWVAA